MTFIDLFAGAGGMSEGFIREGYKPIAHVEIDEAACNTLKTRAAFHYLTSIGKQESYEQYLRGEISRNQLYSLLPEEITKSIINLGINNQNNAIIHNTIEQLRDEKEIDLIIGGPPCQAYSLVGRARSSNGMADDPRNFLFLEYANYLRKYKPKMFVFENVLGLMSANGGGYLNNMKSLFGELNYSIRLYKLNASNFGVLQNRKRVIILGWRSNIKIEAPDLESISFNDTSTVHDLLKDLPKIQAGEGIDKYSKYTDNATRYLFETGIRTNNTILTQHIARSHNELDKEIYRIALKLWESKKERLNYKDLPQNLKTHNNQQSFYDRFKVVAADERYSQTVVAHIAKDGHYYIHPDIEQNRSISVREAARLQSFPDNYYFEGVKEDGNRTAAFKQIGNAVPPLMASIIAKKITSIL